MIQSLCSCGENAHSEPVKGGKFIIICTFCSKKTDEFPTAEEARKNWVKHRKLGRRKWY